DDILSPQADVTISTDPAILSASIGINDYTLEKLVTLITAAKKVLPRLWRLVIIGLLISLTSLLLASAGILTPFYATLVNLANTLLLLILTTDPRARKQQP